jgi:glucose/arabinose dehydrogenase
VIGAGLVVGLLAAASGSPGPPPEPPAVPFIGGSLDRPPEVVLTPAFGDLTFRRPVQVVAAPGGTGSLFVVEQGGRVHQVTGRNGDARGRVFLDLGTRLLTEHNEEGLLGLAFHPRFRDNGHVFVAYTAPPRRLVVARLTAEPDRSSARLETEVALLSVDKPYGNHNGGMVAFGKDGMLYASIGDGGLRADPHDHGQGLGTLLGKIVRLDVDRSANGLPMAVPCDNPFVGTPGARPEIWALGLSADGAVLLGMAAGGIWRHQAGRLSPASPEGEELSADPATAEDVGAGQ